MNYSKVMQDFRAEITKFIQYRRMSSAQKWWTVLGMLPFFLIMGAQIAGYYVILFWYSCFASCSDYLEAWLNDTKKNVQHATEAVLYFVTIPTIFSLRVLLSFFSFIFYLYWFFMMIVTYIATLGGIKWNPFIQNVGNDSNTSYQATTSRKAANVFSVTVSILFVLFLFFELFTILIEKAELYELLTNLMDIRKITRIAYLLFPIATVPFIFKKRAQGSDEDKNAFINTEKSFTELTLNDTDELPDF